MGEMRQEGMAQEAIIIPQEIEPIEMPTALIDNMNQFDAIQTELKHLREEIGIILRGQETLAQNIWEIISIQKNNQIQIKEQIHLLRDDMNQKAADLFSGIGSLKETHLRTSDEISKLKTEQLHVKNDLDMLHIKTDQLAKIIDLNSDAILKHIQALKWGLIGLYGVFGGGILVLILRFFIRG